MESSILTLLIFIPVAGAVLMLPFAMVYGTQNGVVQNYLLGGMLGVLLLILLIQQF